MDLEKSKKSSRWDEIIEVVDENRGIELILLNQDIVNTIYIT